MEINKHWGKRDPDTGSPNYKSVQIGDVLSVTNTIGDHPENAVLANLHAGLAWNLLWSKELLKLVRTRFELRIDGITEEEVAHHLKVSLGNTTTR